MQHPQPAVPTYQVGQYQQPSVILQTSSQQQQEQRSRFAHKTAAGIGITQVILGLASIAAGITAVCKECTASGGGTGIWTGVFFVVTGAFGCLSASKKSKGTIITSMVLSIINASIFCLTLMVVNAVAIAEDQEDYDCVYNEITQRYDCSYLTRHDCMAAEGIMISVSVVSALLAIINSVLCCIGCCCRCCRKTVTPQVVYVPGQEGAIPATNVMYAVQGNQPSGAVYLIPSTTQNMYPYNCTVSHQLPTVQSPPAYPMQSGYTVTQTIPTVQSFPGPAPQRRPEQPQPDQVLDQNATNVSNDTKLPL